MLRETKLLQKVADRVRILQSQRIVVKLGGSAMEDPAATRGMLEAVLMFQTFGVPVALVHGGGKPIDRAMEAAGIVPIKVQGRRYTDELALDIVVRVLHDLRDGLIAQFRSLGGRAVGFDDSPLQGERLRLMGYDLQPIDLGYVGKVTRVETALLNGPLEAGLVPVIPSLARDTDGGWLNINADDAAAAVAGALKAEACLFLTDTPGVLRDRRDPASRLAELSVAEAQELIQVGVIDGGMIPKVQACFDALEAGAASAAILDGRDPQSLPRWLLGEPTGTVVRRM